MITWPYQVGQGNHHESVPGPNVQVIGLHCKLRGHRENKMWADINEGRYDMKTVW